MEYIIAALPCKVDSRNESDDVQIQQNENDERNQKESMMTRQRDPQVTK